MLDGRSITSAIRQCISIFSSEKVSNELDLCMRTYANRERQRIDDEEKELKFLKEFQPQRDSSDSTSDHDDIVTDDATKAFSNSSSSSIPTSASLSSSLTMFYQPSGGSIRSSIATPMAHPSGTGAPRDGEADRPSIVPKLSHPSFAPSTPLLSSSCDFSNVSSNMPAVQRKLKVRTSHRPIRPHTPSAKDRAETLKQLTPRSSTGSDGAGKKKRARDDEIYGVNMQEQAFLSLRRTLELGYIQYEEPISTAPMSPSPAPSLGHSVSDDGDEMALDGVHIGLGGVQRQDSILDIEKLEVGHSYGVGDTTIGRSSSKVGDSMLPSASVHSMRDVTTPLSPSSLSTSSPVLHHSQSRSKMTSSALGIGDRESSTSSLPSASLSAYALSAIISSLASKYPQIRVSTCIILGLLPPEISCKSILFLESVLTDEDPSVREAAATACGSLSCCVDEDGIRKLIALLGDGLWIVRVASCVALAKIGDRAQKAIPFLLHALKDGSLPRYQATRTLAMLGASGQRALLHVLRSQRGVIRVKAAAAEGLAWTSIDSPILEEVSQRLCECVRDRQPTVRCAVLRAITTLAKKTAQCHTSITFLRSSNLLPLLYSFLKDREKNVALLAASLLSACGVQGEMMLNNALHQDTSVSVRESAVHGVACTGVKGLASLLLAFRDVSPIVRNAVSNAVLKLGRQRIEQYVLYEMNRRQCETLLQLLSRVSTNPYPREETLDVLIEEIIGVIRSKIEA
ncbi:hypothetical protein ADUPG1_009179 [Aduncisulcus paluster]|uniref:Uncharacterized protein n=1 Tax=Aduncisulcus paluster TaxID=2918883 RepID=A0ABQ5KUN5_9EUKA|nr:hypothetical protein ADUPG1_009179 [Aduncisulcus paluster]